MEVRCGPAGCVAFYVTPKPYKWYLVYKYNDYECLAGEYIQPEVITGSGVSGVTVSGTDWIRVAVISEFNSVDACVDAVRKMRASGQKMGYGVAEVEENRVVDVPQPPKLPENVVETVKEVKQTIEGKSEEQAKQEVKTLEQEVEKQKEEAVAPEVVPPPPKAKIPLWLILIVILVLFILVIRR